MKNLKDYINEAVKIDSRIDENTEKIIAKLYQIYNDMSRVFNFNDPNSTKLNMSYWPNWVPKNDTLNASFIKKWREGELTKEWDEWVLGGLIKRVPWSESDLNIDFLKHITTCLFKDNKQPEEAAMANLCLSIWMKKKSMLKRSGEDVILSLNNCFLHN